MTGSDAIYRALFGRLILRLKPRDKSRRYGMKEFTGYKLEMAINKE